MFMRDSFLLLLSMAQTLYVLPAGITHKKGKTLLPGDELGEYGSLWGSRHFHSNIFTMESFVTVLLVKNNNSNKNKNTSSSLNHVSTSQASPTVDICQYKKTHKEAVVTMERSRKKCLTFGSWPCL